MHGDRLRIVVLRLYWIKKELANLDAIADAKRIAHLSLEVKYGNKIFLDTLFSMAFARQVAVTRIAPVLYRDGKGIILSQTRKRNDDTLIFFGLMLKYFGTPEGDKIIQRVVNIHSAYPISNDLNLYTLATLAVLPIRIGRQLLGKEIYIEKEKIGVHQFWKSVGCAMGITDIPEDYEGFLDWAIAFEKNNYSTTEGGITVTQALAENFAKSWFPRPLRGFAKQLFYCTFDAHLLETHKIKPPSMLARFVFMIFVRLYFASVKIIPDGKDKSLLDMFGQRYGDDLHYSRVGPQNVTAK